MLNLHSCQTGVKQLRESQIDLGAEYDDFQKLRFTLAALKALRRVSTKRASALEARAKNYLRLGERAAHRHRIAAAKALGYEVRSYNIAELPRQIRRQMETIDLDSCQWPVVQFRDEEWLVIAADRLGLSLTRLPMPDLSATAAALSW